MAVTREEKPGSPILALNREAREKGLTPGLRYASALSLVPDLRAREVPGPRIEEARARIARLLSAYTPDIEPCAFDQDAFWVSVEGLGSLFGSESRWIQEARGALRSAGFPAGIVAGFTRFGTYVLVRNGLRDAVLASREEELTRVGRASLDSLPLPHRSRDILRKLEVRTVRQFLSLPRGEAERRLGREAGLLQQAILADDPLPIRTLELKEEAACRRHLDAPVVDLSLLLPHIGELLASDAARAEAEGSVISGLTLMLRTEDGQVTTDLIRPAAPTLETAVLLRLIELRLSARRLASRVEDIEIRCSRARPSRRQEELFSTRGRDLQAGARAFAAIRARFGDAAVVSARLGNSHLPECSFQWMPVQRPALPSPRSEPSGKLPTAVRRILFSPVPSRFSAPEGDPDCGVLVVSCSWWGEAGQDVPVHREYRFRDTPDGLAWLYHDRLTDTSWIQGSVD